MPQYDRQWAKWCTFQTYWFQRYGTYLVPSERAFELFATWRFNNPIRGKRILGDSIRQEISAINSYLGNRGFQLQLANMLALKRLCKGMNNIVSKESHARAPRVVRRALVNAILDPMLRSLSSSDWNTRIAAAALATGKACGFRPDHFLACANNRYIIIGNLHWLPIVAPYKRLVIYFNASKTNQEKRWEQRIIDCRCPQPCAVHMVWNVCKHRLARKREPVFLLDNGSRFKYKHMRETLMQLCQLFDLDYRYYTPYCFRVGGACEDWWAGASKEFIMNKYGWASESSCDRYLRTTNIDLVRFLPVDQPIPFRKP